MMPLILFTRSAMASRRLTCHPLSFITSTTDAHIVKSRDRTVHQMITHFAAEVENTIRHYVRKASPPQNILCFSLVSMQCPLMLCALSFSRLPACSVLSPRQHLHWFSIATHSAIASRKRLTTLTLHLALCCCCSTELRQARGAAMVSELEFSCGLPQGELMTLELSMESVKF